MSVLLEGTEHLEQELTPEPVMAPATGSVVLHLSLVAGIVLYGILGGFFHHNLWGGPGAGGAVQVNLVSSALPLPSNQPVNQNVLATETPSQAPAPPAPKVKQAEDETAIPIVDKQQKKKPDHETTPKTPPKQQQPIENYRASYGEQSGSQMPHASQQQNFTTGPTSVNNGDFGSRFGWYVDGINRKMGSNWYKSLVDQNTPRGAKAFIDFTIARDGSVSQVKLERSSGSPTLDSSCMRAAQRVDTFGALPGGYNQSTLMVSYYCEY